MKIVSVLSAALASLDAFKSGGGSFHGLGVEKSASGRVQVQDEEHVKNISSFRGRFARSRRDQEDTSNTPTPVVPSPVVPSSFPSKSPIVMLSSSPTGSPTIFRCAEEDQCSANPCPEGAGCQSRDRGNFCFKCFCNAGLMAVFEDVNGQTVQVRDRDDEFDFGAGDFVDATLKSIPLVYRPVQCIPFPSQSPSNAPSNPPGTPSSAPITPSTTPTTDVCNGKCTTCKEVCVANTEIQEGFECKCASGHNRFPNPVSSACQPTNLCLTIWCAPQATCIFFAGGFNEEAGICDVPGYICVCPTGTIGSPWDPNGPGCDFTPDPTHSPTPAPTLAPTPTLALTLPPTPAPTRRFIRPPPTAVTLAPISGSHAPSASLAPSNSPSSSELMIRVPNVRVTSSVSTPEERELLREGVQAFVNNTSRMVENFLRSIVTETPITMRTRRALQQDVDIEFEIALIYEASRANEPDINIRQIVDDVATALLQTAEFEWAVTEVFMVAERPAPMIRGIFLVPTPVPSMRPSDAPSSSHVPLTSDPSFKTSEIDSSSPSNASPNTDTTAIPSFSTAFPTSTSFPTSTAPPITMSDSPTSPQPVSSGEQWFPLGQQIFPLEEGFHTGEDVAMSADGNILAIGVPRGALGYIGVYEYRAGTWEIVGAEITDVDEGGFEFGTSIAISSDGQTVAAGSGYSDGVGPNGAVLTGRARAFTLVDGKWVVKGQGLEGTLCRSLGWSVALSGDGNRWVVSTPDTAGSGNSRCNGIDYGDERGLVQVFDFVNDRWVQLGQNITSRSSSINFGVSVAMSRNGQRVAAYSPESSGSYVQVFEFDETLEEWVQMGSDLVVEVSEYRTRGVTLSRDGSRVALASKRFADGTAFVKVFDWDGESWLQVGADIEDEDGCCFFFTFDSSVALSDDGNRVVFGNSGHEPPGTPNPGIFRGIVRVYDFVDGSWQQVAQPIPGITVPWELWFGYSTTLSADGSRIAAGAPYSDYSYVQAYELGS